MRLLLLIKDVEHFNEVLNSNLFSQFLENADKIPIYKAMGYLPKLLKKSPGVTLETSCGKPCLFKSFVVYNSK